MLEEKSEKIILTKRYLHLFAVYLLFIPGTYIISFFIELLFMMFYDKFINESLPHSQAVIILIIVTNALKIAPFFLSAGLAYYVPKMRFALAFTVISFIVAIILSTMTMQIDF